MRNLRPVVLVCAVFFMGGFAVADTRDLIQTLQTESSAYLAHLELARLHLEEAHGVNKSAETPESRFMIFHTQVTRALRNLRTFTRIYLVADQRKQEPIAQAQIQEINQNMEALFLALNKESDLIAAPFQGPCAAHSASFDFVAWEKANYEFVRGLTVIYRLMQAEAKTDSALSINQDLLGLVADRNALLGNANAAESGVWVRLPRAARLVDIIVESGLFAVSGIASLVQESPASQDLVDQFLIAQGNAQTLFSEGREFTELAAVFKNLKNQFQNMIKVTTLAYSSKDLTEPHASWGYWADLVLAFSLLEEEFNYDPRAVRGEGTFQEERIVITAPTHLELYERCLSKIRSREKQPQSASLFCSVLAANAEPAIGAPKFSLDSSLQGFSFNIRGSDLAQTRQAIDTLISQLWPHIIGFPERLLNPKAVLQGSGGKTQEFPLSNWTQKDLATLLKYNLQPTGPVELLRAGTVVFRQDLDNQQIFNAPFVIWGANQADFSAQCSSFLQDVSGGNPYRSASTQSFSLQSATADQVCARMAEPLRENAPLVLTLVAKAPESCTEIHRNSLLRGVQPVSGSYFIKLPGAFGERVEVTCDMETDGGGWMLISDYSAVEKKVLNDDYKNRLAVFVQGQVQNGLTVRLEMHTSKRVYKRFTQNTSLKGIGFGGKPAYFASCKQTWSEDWKGDDWGLDAGLSVSFEGGHQSLRNAGRPQGDWRFGVASDCHNSLTALDGGRQFKYQTHGFTNYPESVPGLNCGGLWISPTELDSHGCSDGHSFVLIPGDERIAQRPYGAGFSDVQRLKFWMK